MEDSTAMTIDFLRARLLSERSASRTAKQRADELAKKVVELEEQLKTVTLQRKKAEKATVEVLAILENHRINDVLEAFGSNSDQERAPSDTKDDNNSMKEEESSVASKRGNEVEVISGSELEDSPPSGRSLSWKSCSDTPSLEKKISIDKSRREYSFSSSSISSSKSREGKSCRQIRRMEFISASDEVRYESFLFDAQEDGGTSGTGDNSDDFKDGPGITKEGSKNDEKVYSEDPDSIKDEQRESDTGFDVNGSKTHDDMERAVEDQAQFIDQNVAQENAQREWEEKFQENDSRSVESYEPGNQSDMTAERDDPREVVDPSDIIPSCRQEGTLGCKVLGKEKALGIEEARSKMCPNVTLPATSLEMVCSQDQQYKSTSVDERVASFSEFTFTSQETPRSTAKEKEKQDSPGTLSCESSDYQSTKEYSLQVQGNEANGQSSGNLNEPQLAICWHEAPNELEVLQELQRAKLSLKQQLDRSRLTTKAQPATMTEIPSLAIEAASSMNIPIGCAGLFRLPTDLELEATTKTKPLRTSSNSGLDMTKYSLNVGGMGSDQQRTNHYLGISSRDSFQKHYFDPQMSLLSPHRYTSPSYTDFMPKMTSYDGVPRSFPSFRPEMPANDRYSLYSGHVRLNMHHR